MNGGKVSITRILKKFFEKSAIHQTKRTHITIFSITIFSTVLICLFLKSIRATITCKRKWTRSSRLQTTLSSVEEKNLVLLLHPINLYFAHPGILTSCQKTHRIWRLRTMVTLIQISRTVKLISFVENFKIMNNFIFLYYSIAKCWSMVSGTIDSMIFFSMYQRQFLWWLTHRVDKTEQERGFGCFVWSFT